jgi:hypothetical protein
MSIVSTYINMYNDSLPMVMLTLFGYFTMYSFPESEAKLTELIESLLSTNNRDGIVAGGLRTTALVDELLPLIDANARLRPLLAQFKRRIELSKGEDNDIL